jgi:transposase
MEMGRYSKEFKEQVVLKILNNETTIRDISTELEVHYTTVRDWVRSYRMKKDEAFPGSGNRSETDERLMKLMRENTNLKEENEFLKKAAAFFAKSQK